jgi:hypothetical protein
LLGTCHMSNHGTSPCNMEQRIGSTCQKVYLGGQAKVLRFRVPPLSFASISRPLVIGHFLDGDFYFVIAVGAVRYEDGSFWIASNHMDRGHLIKASLRVSTYQVGCAKQKCKNIGGGYGCDTSTDSEYCTNCQTSCSVTLCEVAGLWRWRR